ncbi:hypothetical protein DJ030_01430 [bacterium endosymbiont of Escarpia laminata]|nr:MAG: hypothetical protein DJ030_01430 [bacterium endosymbiont of Escarpia laminata]
MKPTKYFEKVNKLLGYGDPANGLLFIGIEPGGNNTAEQIDEWKDVDYWTFKTIHDRDDALDMPGLVGQPVAIVSSKIAVKLCKQKIAWEEYRNNVLYMPGSRAMNGNLYPIAKESAKEWGKSIEALYGVSKEHYYDYVFEYRKNAFQQLIETHNPQAIVCYGKSNWNNFKLLLDLDGEKAVSYPDYCTEIYPLRRIILTRHFSNGMPDLTVDLIANKLREFGVSI